MQVGSFGKDNSNYSNTAVICYSQLMNIQKYQVPHNSKLKLLSVTLLYHKRNKIFSGVASITWHN